MSDAAAGLVPGSPPGCLVDVRELGEESYVAVLPSDHRCRDATSHSPSTSSRPEGGCFLRESKLDEYLAGLFADHGLAPRTVGRASQKIPDGCEPLIRPLRPALAEPVLAGIRRAPGRAESALLDELMRQDWTRLADLRALPRGSATSDGIGGERQVRP